MAQTKAKAKSSVAAGRDVRVPSASTRRNPGDTMLNWLEVTGYRGFKSYRMDGLTKVNLLVGKNNAGKTALLEGAHLLASGGDVGVFSDIAARRGEVAIRRSESSFIDITHFFNGHTISAESSFKIAAGNDLHPVQVSIVHVKNTTNEETTRRFPPGLYLKIHAGKKERDETLMRLAPDGTVGVELLPPRRRRTMTRTGKAQPRFVGTESLDALEMAEMWDEITVNGQESNIAEALKIIDPDIKTLHFLTGALSATLSAGLFPARGGIVVGMSGVDTRIPLGSMGDGVRRLMALATSLSFSKNSYLFIDEIDTGLHYSVMQDMWKLVVTKAMDANVQVFATTHSWDCIEGLSQLCAGDSKYVNSVSIHKIDRGIDRSIPFSGESVIRMIKADIDPRT